MQESGAIVALDPTNGDILAMASRPGFDPNVLSRELTPKQWVEIVQDEGRPLNNGPRRASTRLARPSK